MVCKKCLKNKEKIEFQTDISSYCNSCVKQFGQPDLIKLSHLNKPKPKQKDISFLKWEAIYNLPSLIELENLP